MFLATLLIAVVALGCVACGSSGAKSQPEAMSEAEDRLQQCPEKAPGRRNNENPRAKKTLVPPGPGSALICRYRGRRTAGPTPAPETEVLHADSRRFQRLLRAFDQLEPARRGAVACPVGRPLRYLVAFHYRSQSDDYVRVDFNGCGLVTNDALKTLFYPSENLRQILR
jgi:hypothetical protein